MLLAEMQAVMRAMASLPETDLMFVSPRAALAIEGERAAWAAVDRYEADAVNWDRRRLKKAMNKARRAARREWVKRVKQTDG